MDYFFQKQRWTDTFLSLHVKKFKRIILFLLIAFSATGTKAQSDVEFNDYVRYSQWVIDSRLGDFYGNTNDFGFTTYNRDLSVKKEVTKWKSGKENPYIDYVAGLVAKATIEAAEYYKNFDWSKPWFKSVEWYGNKCTVPTSPDNLDAINASKMYFGIYNLANDAFKNVAGKNEAGEETATYAQKQLGNALTALGNYNKEYKSDGTGGYAFPASATLNSQDIAGGWFHKKSYLHEMWLDGQYMGPATLAQLINGYSSYSSKKLTDNDWKLITKQFSIVWNMCWDDTEELLYHAFCSEPRSSTWAADAEIWTKAKNAVTDWKGMTAAGHSAAFWGRAEGWYFLALVDVLEQMQIAGLNQSTNANYSCYTTLKGYLDKLALGIAKRQDEKSGCWYQLIGKDGNYSARYYNGDDKGEIKNYLESSCTAIFAAAFLKATRLQLLSSATDGTKTYNYKVIGTNAYKGVVTQFMKQRTDGTVDLFGCCKSAGLGTTGLGDPKFRDGSNAYYLHGHDVAPTSTTSNNYTEGKVLGAFIMAATEYERQYQKSTLLSKDLNKTYNLSSNQSLTVEVLGDGTATYQWYNVTESTESPITGANGASYTPTQSGKYYCEITVTPKSAAAKTRGTSTSGSYTIKTSIAEVYVAAATTNDLFTLTDVTTSTVSVSKKTEKNVTSEYATITGGSAVLYNGSSKSADMITNSQINLKGSSSSYLKITLDNSLKVGDEIIINPATSSFKLSAKNSNSDAKSITDRYVIKEGDAVVGKNVIYLYKGDNSVIEDIKITRNYPESDSRATFTYNDAAITFSEKTAGNKSVYTTTLEIGASKAGQLITITPTKQEGATIKQNNEIVNGDITITVPTIIGEPTTSTYTVTSKDGTSTTTYEIIVKLVKENVVLVYAQSGGKTEWTWDTSKNPTKPTFTNPTLTVYLANADGTKSDQEVTVSGIQYMSDVEDVATVDNTGTITINNDANGGAKIYAILKDNDYYNDAQTFFNILVKQGYSYSVATDTEISNGPDLNQSVYIKNGETKLVKMTFGGWKWNTFTDKNDNNKLKSTYVVNEKTRTDEWKNPITSDESVIASIDGYKTYISGATDAVDESKKASDDVIYGSTRYGWFKPAKKRDDGYLETYPYSLPVRGAYMTFEPTQNGTLTVYILQNGAWNTNGSGNYQGIDYKEGDIIPGEFRPHSFYICNQRGLNVHQFSPKTFNCTTKQKVKGSYYCDLENHKDDPYNIATWTEFSKYMSKGEQDSVAANWKSGINGAQKIVRLDNGSYLAIEKGIVKYTFFVTANETYYLFSNFSKLGFCGANFVPSETVKPTNDVDHNITLSDVSAYPTPKKVTDDTDADKNKYAWKFGNDIKGYVKGFTIPLFNSITLNRTFKPNQWTTLSLPFNLTQTEVEQIFGKGTQIIVFDKAETTPARTYLTFFYHEIQNVLPGYPYLIRPTLVDADGKQMVTKSNSADYAPTYTINTEGKLTEFTVYNKAINPAIKQHEFVYGDYTAKCTPLYCTADVNGNYSKKYENGDIFVSENNGTVYISEGRSYGKGYRSYIDYTGTTATAKALSISFSGVEDGDDNGTTTDIRIAELADDVIETLGIGGVYNLNGQKVADTTRNLPAGIYIVNGRKVVVK